MATAIFKQIKLKSNVVRHCNLIKHCFIVLNCKQRTQNLNLREKLNETMSEIIELKSSRNFTTAGDNDIEEYHEIHEENVDTVTEVCISPKFTTTSINEFDFFTETHVKITSKGSGKKKKHKKKDKSQNLMDIISSELASVTVPVIANVINARDYPKEERQRMLVASDRGLRSKLCFKYHDAEHGWNYRAASVNLNAVFPNVSETTDKNSPIDVQYVKPLDFNYYMANYEGAESKQKAKFLDITLKDLKFKHHHTFSLEKLLVVKLIEIYNEFKNIDNRIDNLCKEIKINRETKNNLKLEFVRISPKKEQIRFDETLRKYTNLMLKAKEKYFSALKQRKELVHKIISLWQDIELVRDKTGCVQMPYILDITKTDLNNYYDSIFDTIFNLEYSDILDKIEFEYVNDYMEYKELKHSLSKGDFDRKNIIKPKLDVDEAKLKVEVENIVKTILSKEEINVTLRKDKTIISDTLPHKHIDSKSYTQKLYVDNVFVCESEEYLAKNQDIIETEFTESFSVEILPNNEILNIILCENGENVSYIKIKLTEIRNLNNPNEFITRNFVYKDIVEPNSQQIGSGYNIKEIASVTKVRLKSSNVFKGNLYTNGEVSIKICWNEKLSNLDGDEIQTHMEIGRQIKRLMHGIDTPSIDLLKDLITQLYGKEIDDNDEIIDSLINICKANVNHDDTFPIPENSAEFTRLQLLHLRNNGGFTDVENKMVPIHASQITTEQLNILQKGYERDFEIQYFNDKYTDEMNPIDIQRFIGYKYLDKLNKNMLKNISEYLLKKTQKDVVRDFKNLNLRSLFSSETNLRDLTSISANTKYKLMRESLGKEQDIQVTILRAFNLSDRNSDVAAEEEYDNNTIAGFKVRALRPMVKISYHNTTLQTTTAIGCHPTWNQTLRIKTRLEPLSSLRIEIFDSETRWLGLVTVPMRAVLAVSTISGTFKISTPPLILGYNNSIKESTHSLIPQISQLKRKDSSFISLEISTSLAHITGSQGYNQPVPSNTEEDYLIKHLNIFVSDFLNDFPSRNISLTFIDTSGTNKCVTQFLQPIPLPEYENFPKNPKRSESAVSKSSGHSKSSSSKSSTRRRDSTFRDIDIEKGSTEDKESMYSTYDYTIKFGDNQLGKLMDAAVRYVSLIPTYEVRESHVVTLLGLELLKILQGSPLDHTVLLTSYFLYLGIRCWVAIGLGLPRGLSSYVLTQYDVTTKRMILVTDQLFKKRGFWTKNDGCLWYVFDATTGERFELRDVSCPLKTVFYVFDNENIWVNVQSSQDCESVSFDFSKSSDWSPVFDKSVFVMKQPIALESGLYSTPSEVESLRVSLETKIKNKIQKWRSRMKTIWNRYCSTLLREMLPYWEYWSFNPNEPKPPLSHRLRQLMASYKIFGFPLNMAYSNSKAVVSRIKSTLIYVNDDPNVEFGLGIEVYAYPNNILSVWVFIVNITRV